MNILLYRYIVKNRLINTINSNIHNTLLDIEYVGGNEFILYYRSKFKLIFVYHSPHALSTLWFKTHEYRDDIFRLFNIYLKTWD